MSKSTIYLLFAIVALVSCQSKKQSGFKNLDFNNACENFDSICSWQNTYRANSLYEYTSNASDKSNLTLSMTNTNNGVGFVEQTLQLKDTDKETIFTFSAQIKTENLKGKGAGLNIAIYDDKNVMLQNVDMGYSNYNFVKNTTDWQTKTLQAIIPSDAAFVKIGLISYGTGKAFFDNAKTTLTTIKNKAPSSFAKNYIDKAGDSIALHSLFREEFNISQIKQKAYAIAGDAKTGKDMHLSIQYMLGEINDSHAFFMPADIRKKWEGTASDPGKIENITYSESSLIDQYGYISVPGFHSIDSSLSIAFADTIQQQIQDFLSQKVKGFIIDLRNNDGGNMYPMLAGLEPLFSTDTLGFLVDINNKKEYWGRGESFKKSQSEVYVQPTITAPPIKGLPIAVLYGNRTGSSGEIIIISFIDNENTKSFGQPSYGLTTGNEEYCLPDSSYMFLSSTYMADRNGEIYRDRITPNVTIEDKDDSTDQVLTEALKWLRTQH